MPLQAIFASFRKQGYHIIHTREGHLVEFLISKVGPVGASLLARLLPSCTCSHQNHQDTRHPWQTAQRINAGARDRLVRELEIQGPVAVCWCL